MRVFVCLCVCLFICENIAGTTRPIFTKSYVLVAYCRGSVLLGQRCDTLRDGATL